MDDNSGSAKRSRTLRQELADLDKIFLHIQNQQAKQQRELVQHVQAEQLMKVDIRGLEEQAPQEKKQRRNDLDQEQMDPKSMKTDINRVRMREAERLRKEEFKRSKKAPNAKHASSRTCNTQEWQKVVTSRPVRDAFALAHTAFGIGRNAHYVRRMSFH